MQYCSPQLSICLEGVRLGRIDAIPGFNPQLVKQNLPIFDHQVISPAGIHRRRWQQGTNLRRIDQIIYPSQLNTLVFPQQREPNLGPTSSRFSLHRPSERMNVVRVLVNPFFHNATIQLSVLADHYKEIGRRAILYSIEQVQELRYHWKIDAARQGTHVDENVAESH